MNQITDPPNNYDFGLEYNYEQWTPDTNITLCNVPWDNTYRDIVKFADRAALNSYIDSLETSSVRIENASYARVNEPIRISVPFGRAQRFNYVRVQNPAQPVYGSDMPTEFYYFIVGVRHAAPNTTEIIVQLDVWQTFGHDVTFGNAFVVQGHVGIANENADTNWGANFLTEPEGLDTEADYQNVLNVPAYKYLNGDVAIASTINLTYSPGTSSSPQLNSARGSNALSVRSPVEMYMVRAANVQNYFSEMREYPWITQGIFSVTMIPDVSDFAAAGGSFAVPQINNYPPGQSGSPDSYLRTFAQTVNANVQRVLRSNWRQEVLNSSYIPTRYRHLTKFFTSPYMMVELTAYQGSPVGLKPERWNSADAEVFMMLSIVPGSERISVVPAGYNAALASGSSRFQGDSLDAALTISPLPKLPTINDGAALALASTAGSRAAQRQGAQWAFQRVNAANQLQYDQATLGMNLSDDLAHIARNADTSQVALANSTARAMQLPNNIAGIAGGGLGGLPAGPIGAGIGAAMAAGNALTSHITLGIQQQHEIDSLAIRNNSSIASQQSQTNAAAQIRDTNKGLADYAARGDYQASIAAMQGQVQDMQLTPPQMTAQFGGDFMNYAYGFDYIHFKVKMIGRAAIRRIGEYWLRYGYAINRFMQPPTDLHCMTHFTYWKLLETSIVQADMPELYKNAIRGIFEKGVTVWRNPSDIGVIDTAVNQPIEGISYE